MTWIWHFAKKYTWCCNIHVISMGYDIKWGVCERVWVSRCVILIQVPGHWQVLWCTVILIQVPGHWHDSESRVESRSSQPLWGLQPRGRGRRPRRAGLRRLSGPTRRLQRRARLRRTVRAESRVKLSPTWHWQAHSGSAAGRPSARCKPSRSDSFQYQVQVTTGSVPTGTKLSNGSIYATLSNKILLLSILHILHIISSWQNICTKFCKSTWIDQKGIAQINCSYIALFCTNFGFARFYLLILLFLVLHIGAQSIAQFWFKFCIFVCTYLLRANVILYVAHVCFRICALLFPHLCIQYNVFVHGLKDDLRRRSCVLRGESMPIVPIGCSFGPLAASLAGLLSPVSAASSCHKDLCQTSTSTCWDRFAAAAGAHWVQKWFWCVNNGWKWTIVESQMSKNQQLLSSVSNSYPHTGLCSS